MAKDQLPHVPALHSPTYVQYRCPVPLYVPNSKPKPSESGSWLSRGIESAILPGSTHTLSELELIQQPSWLCQQSRGHPYHPGVRVHKMLLWETKYP